ncbi:hypothetical protein EMPG_10112, partial [Blastomyces silverae]
MQFTIKSIALALLLAPLALAAPAENKATAACKPGTYDCSCWFGTTTCWIDVCNSRGEWQLSARCKDRSHPDAPASCRDGPNGAAYC